MGDAKFKTMRHIEIVRNYLNACIRELMIRQEQHDQSKLESPEVEAYDATTSQLRGLAYRSEEYCAVLRAQQPAIDHHYQHNRHHPEFHSNGCEDMNLIDLLEMICDWKAATLRHDDGDIYKSLEINHQRFGYSYQLHHILKNTVDWIEAQSVYHKVNES